MMKLSCKDLDSSSSCDFEATGDSAEEVARKTPGVKYVQNNIVVRK